jgi:hypothetical protein
MMAVFYSIMWEIIYLRVREMEPFFQLASPHGAPSKSSLCLDYASSGLPTTLFKSLINSHWIVLSASVVSFIISTSVALASEIFYIGTTGTCTSTGNGSDCHPFLALRPALAQGESALIATVFFFAVFILLQYRKRRSGIYAEATSIAGLATLLQDPAIIDSLCRIPRIPQEPSNSELKKYLNRRYGLGQGYYNGVTTNYGLVSVDVGAAYRMDERTDGYTQVQLSDGPYAETPQSRYKPKNQRPLSLTIPALSLFWLILAGLLTIIVYYRLVGTMSGFEAFMDSQGIGVRFMMTAVGVLIKSNWILIERSMRPAFSIPPRS